MKKATLFYLRECPYCIRAFALIDELKAENPGFAGVEFDLVEEEESPEIIANYNYERVPCFFFGDKKAFEAYPMIPNDVLREGIKGVMQEAVSE